MIPTRIMVVTLSVETRRKSNGVDKGVDRVKRPDLGPARSGFVNLGFSIATHRGNGKSAQMFENGMHGHQISLNTGICSVG